MKILRGARGMGLAQVATHLGGLERLTPRPLHSALSEIFDKQGASPFRPKRGRHISGRSPRPVCRPRVSLGRGLAAPALRLCQPGVPLHRLAHPGLQCAECLLSGPGGASAFTVGPSSGVGVRLSLWPARFLRVYTRSDHIATLPPKALGASWPSTASLVAFRRK